MAGKAKKAPTIEDQVRAYADFAKAQTNPGVVGVATFEALKVLARGIDELRAEAKK